MHRGAGLAVAEVDVGAGHLLEHEGEILRRRGRRLVAIDVGLADELGRRIGDGARRLGRVDEGSEDQPVVDFGLGAEPLGNADRNALQPRLYQASVSRFMARTVPPMRARSGMTL